MRSQIAFIYIRKDVSGVHLRRDEFEARDRARESGYGLDRTLVDGPDGRGMTQLLRLIDKPDADVVVILPSLAHLPDDIDIDELGKYADVLTVVPRVRWAKRRTELRVSMTSARRPRTLNIPQSISEETASIPVVHELATAVDEAERRYSNAKAQ